MRLNSFLTLKKVLIILVLAVIFFLMDSSVFRQTPPVTVTFQPDYYGFGSRAVVEIQKIRNLHNDLAVFCESDDSFIISGLPGPSKTKSECETYIQALPSKRLVQLTLSKNFRANYEGRELEKIAKNYADWLKKHGFQRVFVDAATAGLLTIFLHDSEYANFPERAIREPHVQIEPKPKINFEVGF